MKKIVGIVLACTMIFSLVACGSGNSKEESKEVSSAAKGYVFSTNNVEVAMDVKADDVIKALGTNYKYFEAASCAFKGLDKTYEYGKAFVVGTYPKDDVDYISYVYLKDNTVSTKEGIKVGDTIDAMKKAYGDAKADETGGYEYTKDNMSLKFISTDGTTIDEIDYSSNATKTTTK
ncbi:MAG: hypothetical protein Q4G58_14480 [bacterium]|nr:hypothetical protein [bacterium]